MTAPNALQSTVKLYQSVMDEVVANVKETFLDEGIDEAVLQELKQIWESKVLATKVVDTLNPAAITSAPVSTIKSTQNNNQNSNNQQSGSKQQQNEQQKVHQQQEQLAQQQQNLRSELPQIQYNPGLNVRPRPMSLIQHVPPAPAAAPTTVVTPNPMVAAISRGLPQSVITNAHGNVFMQLPGVPGTSIRMIGPQIPTISAVPTGLPPALTSIMNSRPIARPPHLQQQQQQPPPLTMGSNVIVIPHSSGSASGSGSTGKDSKPKVVIQLDGPGALSDDDDDEILEDEDEMVPEDEDEPTPMPVEEGDALNSEDDEKSSENADEMFEADDVVVCQFEKVNRIRNKWKFVLKDGIINLGRKDYVFNKAIGEAEF